MQSIADNHARPYFPESPVDIQNRIAAGEGLTLGRAMELRGLNRPGIDTALPYAWCERIYQRTGEWPHGHVVWSYVHGSPNFGEPIAITATGEHLIRSLP